MQGSQTLKPISPIDPVEPLIEGQQTYASVTDTIGNIVLTHPLQTKRIWFVGLGIAFLFLMLFIVSVVYLILKGVGIWGINIPVAWGMDIINFVWWIGIGHAGTLISAILLLLRQDWRTSINRFAEAMTLFAVACAGTYPLLHTGRPYLDYWLFPYPNTLGMWPQFRSPLDWDVFAVSTYATVSLMFWLVGLIPDFATMRDKATNPVVKFLFGLAAVGWRGSASHWHRYEVGSLLLAALSTPLVLSVHSIISLDFAVAQIPGWNVTVFPPYFVAGAVFAGFAMVIALMIPMRAVYKLHSVITMKHFDVMAKVLMATGLIVFYGYMCEIFFGWYSGSPIEQFMVWNRLFGPYGWAYWALIFCNGLTPQIFWFKRFRQSIPVLMIVSVIVSVGMWLERFVIIAVGLHRDFVPSSWGYYTPSFWDWSLYFGTFGLFATLMFLFVRCLPMIAMFETRALVAKVNEAEHLGVNTLETGPLTADVQRG